MYTDSADTDAACKVCAGGPLHGHVLYMRSRSASTVNKHVNKQLPRVIAHLAVFILFYRRIVQVRVATGIFTQPAHAQLVLLLPTDCAYLSAWTSACLPFL